MIQKNFQVDPNKEQHCALMKGVPTKNLENPLSDSKFFSKGIMIDATGSQLGQKA